MSDQQVETNERGGRQSRLAERSDLMPPAAFLAVAAVLKQGAAKYGDRNWRLIDTREHLNHALTHAYKWLAGDTAEAHLEHAACRLLMALEIQLVGMDKPAGEKVPLRAYRPPDVPDEWEYDPNCTCKSCQDARRGPEAL